MKALTLVTILVIAGGAFSAFDALRALAAWAMHIFHGDSIFLSDAPSANAVPLSSFGLAIHEQLHGDEHASPLEMHSDARDSGALYKSIVTSGRPQAWDQAQREVQDIFENVTSTQLRTGLLGGTRQDHASLLGLPPPEGTEIPKAAFSAGIQCSTRSLSTTFCSVPEHAVVPREYDVYVIFLDGQLERNLAQRYRQLIRDTDKPVMVVRTGVDSEIVSAFQRHWKSPKDTQAQMRREIKSDLSLADESCIYLISSDSNHLHHWDMKRLRLDLSAHLGEHQRKRFQQNLRSKAEDYILLSERRAEDIVWQYSLQAAGVGTVCSVLPGSALLLNIPAIMYMNSAIALAFGVDKEQIKSAFAHSSFEQASGAAQTMLELASHFASEYLSREAFVSLLGTMVLEKGAAEATKETAFSYIPVIGSVFAGGSAYTSTSYVGSTVTEAAKKKAREMADLLMEE